MVVLAVLSQAELGRLLVVGEVCCCLMLALVQVGTVSGIVGDDCPPVLGARCGIVEWVLLQIVPLSSLHVLQLP